MKEALQIEWDSEMNSPTAITYPGLPASVISDPAWTKEKVRTRASSNLCRLEVFDGIRAGVASNRAQFYKDLTLPSYGYNRLNAKVSEAIRERWWLQGMMGGVKSHYDCIKAFSETDFTEDLKEIDVPTLILHGDDDQIVPIADSSLLSVKLLKNSTLKVYPGFSHGMCTTNPEQINMDLLTFVQLTKQASA